MLVWDERRRTHEVWAWLAALAAAVLLLAALATPMAAAAPSKTTLSNAVVSPRTGTTATTILISVVFRNSDGSRSDGVTATVGTIKHAMSPSASAAWGKGVTFTWSGKLPIGTQAVVITARAKDHSEATLAAGSVTIAPVATPTPKPTPTPTPTPKPTAKPTPTPTPAPRRTASPTPRLTQAPGVTGLSIGPTATQSPIATPAIADATARPTAVVQPDFLRPVATPTASPGLVIATIAGGTGPAGSAGSGSGTRGLPGGHGTGHPGPWGPIAGLFALVGLPAPSLPSFSLAPTLVTTTGAVTAAMAFGLFGRRRRDDDDPSDDVLAAAAARGLEVAPAALAGVAVAERAADGAAVDVGADAPDALGAPLGADLEALMPRWRRPSLLQARKADPIRDSTPAARLTFDQGLVGKLDGRERRIIRYRLVRLLDSPDELRGGEIGYLDQGDEVQLLEKYGAYWLVLCPDGRQGWVPKMTLGEVIDDDGPAEGPVATMPIVAETWTMGEADDDSDVFAAYLEAQRRRRES
ncbi:MAG TPA: SH3 domain-containing protein [Candidatus Limnocylindrales bacterium]|nr:SH3 domain-containing protein [Candidatus Limnocylindrales bacterium]